MTRRPLRVWSENHSERARESLKDLRRRLGPMSIYAPLGSREYKAICDVMQATADALRVFGEDVVIPPAAPRV
jgi:hypothetical protein